MSVQKLVSEAEKLLEKGKYREGIAKLKQAVQQEPLNQIIATKLANILVQNKEPREAVKVFSILAKNLSESGKSHVATAIYKQAIELDPDDVSLRVRFAQECEAAGKSGDALIQGQLALNHYVRRKKYFDAANLFPLLVRAQSKDEKIKIAWVEVMQLCQAEQKVIHLLVALCGPPGLISNEFQIGGEPTALSPILYESLKRLVPFIPRDPRVPYAMAWCAYRRGQMKDFFAFIHESLRRAPDFTLSLLLFARFLAEDKKLLNEAYFVYQHFKERMPADKSVDMLTLNRLLEAFLEKNGWIKFNEGSSESLDANSFIKAITGVDKKTAIEKDPVQTGDEPKGEGEKKSATKGSGVVDLPPAEIELGGVSLAAPDSGMEIVLTTGQTMPATNEPPIPTTSSENKAPEPPSSPMTPASAPVLNAPPPAASPPQPRPVAAPVEEKAQVLEQASVSIEKQAVEAREISPQSKFQDTSAVDLEGFKGGTVEFTSLIKKLPEEPVTTATSTDLVTSEASAKEINPVGEAAPEVKVAEAENEKTQPSIAAAEPEQAKKLFNPLEQVAPSSQSGGSSLRLENQADERTKMFDPLDILDAGKVMQNKELESVETRSVLLQEKQNAPQAMPDEASKPKSKEEISGILEENKKKWRQVAAEGDKTQPFSPLEAVQAAADSRRPMEAVLKQQEPAPLETPADFKKDDATVLTSQPEKSTVEGLQSFSEQMPGQAGPVIEGLELNVSSSEPGDLELGGFNVPAATIEPSPTSSAEAPAELISPIDIQSEPQQPDVQELQVSTENEPVFEQKAEPESPIVIAEEKNKAEAIVFMPIPSAEAVASPKKPDVEEENVDLGDDLLEGDTRIFTQPTKADKTEHLFKEIKQELKRRVSSSLNIDMLLKKAERYTAKRNYYLARKALRHAQALGADEALIKDKLREIRKIELPEGLYNTMSSDEVAPPVDTSELIEKLEREFDLTESDVDDSEEISSILERQTEEIFQASDPRTILDFGIGLHEMGLFRQAESLFIRLVSEHPDYAFDAYYLAAISKLSRRDYAGAASILKRLSADAGKSDLEKIQIYYALGETFEKMRQLDRSKQFFRKVAELDANYRNIRHKLGE